MGYMRIPWAGTGMGISSKVDVALKLYDAVSNTLLISGLSEDTAKKYANFAWQLYNYIEDSPQLQTALQGAKSTFEGARGAKGYIVASRLKAGAATMNALGSAEKYAAQGNVSAGKAISAFVDYFVAIARSLHIEMNECAIAVTKVMLDVLAVIAMADAVLTLWAAALQVLSLKADSINMIKACGVAS